MKILIFFFIFISSVGSAQSDLPCNSKLSSLGLYELIPAHMNWSFGSYHFNTKIEKVDVKQDPDTEWLRVTTDISNGDRKVGEIIRDFSRERKAMIFQKANLKHVSDLERAPSFLNIKGVPSLVPDRGVPTLTFITLQQMKLVGVHYGELKMVLTGPIQNFQTMIELRRNPSISEWVMRNPNSAIPDHLISQAIPQTQTGRHIETVLSQSGHRILKITSLGNGGLEADFILPVALGILEVLPNDFLLKYDVESTSK